MTKNTKALFLLLFTVTGVLPTCSDNPADCLNGATCTDMTNGGVTCSCVAGYEGRYCQTSRKLLFFGDGELDSYF